MGVSVSETTAETAIAIEVTFEDGRKGELRGRVAIRDARTFPAPTREKAA